MKSTLRSIELLAPARDADTGIAAVDYGADAVYIGGALFGARRAAANSTGQVARLAEYAHRYGVRVHAAFNTLIYAGEVRRAQEQARELIEAGVDALIVQDMGVLRMELPPVELHASTQLCNTTPEWVDFLGRCGFSRVVLERALSLEQIRAIRAASEVALECFVHGAICVGYSGRCYLSRSMGPRSGNRGECSQPCRLPYDLTDGRGGVYMRGRHLLSVRDLNLSQHVGAMIDAGVDSFKIEGRLKERAYVQNVVAYYRRVLDERIAERPLCRRSSSGVSEPDFTPDPAKSFSRGETIYLFEGKRAGVASFDTPKALGEALGRVARADRGGFLLDRDADVAAGDGLLFMRGGAVAGARVERVQGRRIVPNRMEGIGPGAEVFRNSDRRFRSALERSRTRRVIPARASAAFREGGIEIEYVDCDGNRFRVARPGPFAPARDEEAMRRTLDEQLRRSGDTIFRIDDTTVSGEPRFVPVSLLASLRRDALEGVLAERLRRAAPRSERRAEELQARCPAVHLDGSWNVANPLAEAFYRDHGAERIEPALDTAPSLDGERVMRSGYCIRRELGECLLRHPRLRGELYLEHGPFRYRLEFDCAHCEMNLIKENPCKKD